MKRTQTFILGPGTLTLNGVTYPCSSLTVEQDYPERVNADGVITHLGPPTINIRIKHGPERTAAP